MSWFGPSRCYSDSKVFTRLCCAYKLRWGPRIVLPGETDVLGNLFSTQVALNEWMVRNVTTVRLTPVSYGV